jgi:methyl-accepting chemotaxis protein
MIFTRTQKQDLSNNSELQDKLSALYAVQAVIEFEPNGLILHANQNFLNALGYSLNEIEGKHHSMFVEKHYAESSEYKEFWQDLAKGITQSKRFKRITKAGEEIWIEASYNPLKNSKGEVYKVIKFAVDVTERYKAEQAAVLMNSKLASQMEESLSNSR